MGNLDENKHFKDHYIHPRLGKIVRIQQHNEQQYIQYTVSVPNKEKYCQWESTVKCLSKHLNSSLFLPLSYSLITLGFCASGGQVQLLYKGYMFVLRDEIRNRAKIQRPFLQAVLWDLLYSFAKALVIMEQSNVEMGEISTKNILVDEDGNLQIVSQYSWPRKSRNLVQQYMQLLRIVKLRKEIEHSPEAYHPDSLYFSPEQLEAGFRGITVQEGIPSVDSINTKLRGFKVEMSQLGKSAQSGVFAVGVALLETATLQDCMNLYELSSDKQLIINRQMLSQSLAQLEQRYSTDFMWILKQMLRIEPQSRIVARDLYQIMKPYQELIVKAEEFTVGLLADLDQHSTGRSRNFKRISLTDLQSKCMGQATLSQKNHIKPLPYINRHSESRDFCLSVLMDQQTTFPSHQLLTNFIYTPIGSWVPMHVLPYSQRMSPQESVPLAENVAIIPQSTVMVSKNVNSHSDSSSEHRLNLESQRCLCLGLSTLAKRY